MVFNEDLFKEDFVVRPHIITAKQYSRRGEQLASGKPEGRIGYVHVVLAG